MTQLTLQLRPNVTVLAVLVPEGAHSFKISRDNPDELYYLSYDNGTGYRDGPDLVGKWEIIGLLREITPEMAEPLVQKKFPGYRNYIDDRKYWDNHIDSLKSAFLAQGHSPHAHNWLLLKQIP